MVAITHQLFPLGQFSQTFLSETLAPAMLHVEQVGMQASFMVSAKVKETGLRQTKPLPFNAMMVLFLVKSYNSASLPTATQVVVPSNSFHTKCNNNLIKIFQSICKRPTWKVKSCWMIIQTHGDLPLVRTSCWKKKFTTEEKKEHMTKHALRKIAVVLLSSRLCTLTTSSLTSIVWQGQKISLKDIRNNLADKLWTATKKVLRLRRQLLSNARRSVWIWQSSIVSLSIIIRRKSNVNCSIHLRMITQQKSQRRLKIKRMRDSYTMKEYLMMMLKLYMVEVEVDIEVSKQRPKLVLNVKIGIRKHHTLTSSRHQISSKRTIAETLINQMEFGATQRTRSSDSLTVIHWITRSSRLMTIMLDHT